MLKHVTSILLPRMLDRHLWHNCAAWHNLYCLAQPVLLSLLLDRHLWHNIYLTTYGAPQASVQLSALPGDPPEDYVAPKMDVPQGEGFQDPFNELGEAVHV